jgi:salicylate hydroxylase
MANPGRIFYIAGAGIAGMTLALALAKFGAKVVVLERNDAIQAFGAGLQISPNARKVLDQLGLDRAIADTSFEPAGIDVRPFGARRPLVTLALGDSVRRRYGAPYAVMHRADLAEALYRACRRFANIDILFGVRGFDAVSHERGVSVSVDEASGQTRTARAHAFIGADGVNSDTRTRILGGPAASYSGYVAWRATLPYDRVTEELPLDRTTLMFAPGFHAVSYPLAQRREVNLALFVKADLDQLDPAQPPTAPTLPRAARSAGLLTELVATARGRWGHWIVNIVDAPSWSEGGIGLVGDAAHAMLPFQAQGAAMAIEDAAILGPLLMTEPDAATALKRFETLRRTRVERVRKTSDFNGFAYHMGRPLSLARDGVLRLQGPRGHLKRLDWLYGFETLPEPSLPHRARSSHRGNG